MKIFKFFKNSKDKKVIVDNHVVLNSNSKISNNPSSGLTPERLTRIFRSADEGDISTQMELFEEMEEKDPHLFSQLQTRKNAVTGLDFEIIATSEKEADKKVAEFVKEQIANIKNFDSGLMDMLDALGKGISFVEILWECKSNNLLTVSELKYIHQKNFFWDDMDILKIKTKENTRGEEVFKDKFIIHKYKAKSGHDSRAGLLRIVAWVYLFKNYALKDWVTFVEKYAMPILIGKYEQSANEEDKFILTEVLKSLGTDGAGAINKETEIEIIENNKTSSAEVYEKLVRYCDEQMSKAILGQTLTSDSGGSYAQSKTHNEVRHDLTSADCKALASTLKEYLITPLVRYNFSEDTPIPELVFDFDEAEDLLQVAEMYSKIINELGLEIPTEHLYKKFKIPKPDENQEVAKGEKLDLKSNILSFKEDEKTINTDQKTIDELANKLTEKSLDGFKKQVDVKGKPWIKKKYGNNRKKILNDTGALRKSITYKADDEKVIVGTNLKYAAAHQFGTKRYTIKAKRAKSLKFKIGNRWISKKKVKVKIPKRSFLGISEDDKKEIKEILNECVEGAIKNNK